MNSRPRNGELFCVLGLPMHLRGTVENRFFQLWSNHFVDDRCLRYDSNNVLLSTLPLKKRFEWNGHRLCLVPLVDWQQWLVQICGS